MAKGGDITVALQPLLVVVHRARDIDGENQLEIDIGRRRQGRPAAEGGCERRSQDKPNDRIEGARQPAHFRPPRPPNRHGPRWRHASAPITRVKRIRVIRRDGYSA